MGRGSFFSEFSAFMMENKKWWMLPIIAMFLILGLIILAAGASPVAAPFIYTLF
ncbi:MAG: hypothetical protein HQL31_00640 [Planctomycetes bacterium]|nr:hypothetical protein [Planctomycetota bacterium]